jgi:hypothetical protein
MAEGRPDFSKAGALRAPRAIDSAVRQLKAVKSDAVDPSVDATDIGIATSLVAVDGLGSLTNLTIGTGLAVTSGVLSATGGGGGGNTYFPGGW